VLGVLDDGLGRRAEGVVGGGGLRGGPDPGDERVEVVLGRAGLFLGRGCLLLASETFGLGRRLGGRRLVQRVGGGEGDGDGGLERRRLLVHRRLARHLRGEVAEGGLGRRRRHRDLLGRREGVFL